MSNLRTTILLVVLKMITSFPSYDLEVSHSKFLFLHFIKLTSNCNIKSQNISTFTYKDFYIFKDLYEGFKNPSLKITARMNFNKYMNDIYALNRKEVVNGGETITYASLELIKCKNSIQTSANVRDFTISETEIVLDIVVTCELNDEQNKLFRQEFLKQSHLNVNSDEDEDGEEDEDEEKPSIDNSQKKNPEILKSDKKKSAAKRKNKKKNPVVVQAKLAV